MYANWIIVEKIMSYNFINIWNYDAESEVVQGYPTKYLSTTPLV